MKKSPSAILYILILVAGVLIGWLASPVVPSPYQRPLPEIVVDSTVYRRLLKEEQRIQADLDSLRLVNDSLSNHVTKMARIDSILSERVKNYIKLPKYEELFE